MNLSGGQSVLLIGRLHVNGTLKAEDQFKLFFMPVGEEFGDMKKLRMEGQILLKCQIVIVKFHVIIIQYSGLIVKF